MVGLLDRVIPQMTSREMKKKYHPEKAPLFASVCKTPLGFMAALCDAKGLYALRWQQTAFDLPINDTDVSRETITQIKAYLAGDLKQFSLPLSPHAVSPKLRLWLDAIASVPYGQTVSYAGLAKIWGNEKAARAAGSACQKNPLPLIIPCHRIIGTDGSYDKYSGGDSATPTAPANVARKKALLDLEAGLLKIL